MAMSFSPKGFKMNWLGYENGSIVKGRLDPMFDPGSGWRTGIFWQQRFVVTDKDVVD
jgi:hypothetical protein